MYMTKYLNLIKYDFVDSVINSSNSIRTIIEELIH